MKTLLTTLAIVLLVLVTQSISSGLFSAHAQEKRQRHCVWTYIDDAGQPNIGEDGQIDFSKGPNWKKVSDEGWELKAIKPGSNTYIFERCE
jgi:hypothetical protein